MNRWLSRALILSGIAVIMLLCLTLSAQTVYAHDDQESSEVTSNEQPDSDSDSSSCSTTTQDDPTTEDSSTQTDESVNDSTQQEESADSCNDSLQDEETNSDSPEPDSPETESEENSHSTESDDSSFESPEQPGETSDSEFSEEEADENPGETTPEDDPAESAGKNDGDSAEDESDLPHGDDEDENVDITCDQLTTDIEVNQLKLTSADQEEESDPATAEMSLTSSFSSTILYSTMADQYEFVNEDAHFIIDTNVFTGGANIDYVFKTITVNDNINVSTRQLAAGDDNHIDGNSVGPSGYLYFTAQNIILGESSMLLAHHHNDPSLAGEIKLTAENEYTEHFILGTIFPPEASIEVGTGALIKGGDIEFKAQSKSGSEDANDPEEANPGDENDCTIEKLKETLEGVVDSVEEFAHIRVMNREAKAEIYLSDNSKIISSGNVSIFAEATADASVKAEYASFSLGYSRALAVATVNIEGEIDTASDIEIASRATAITDMTAVVANNSGGFGEAALAITDANMVSTVIIAEDAEINSGGSVLIKAEGEISDNVYASSSVGYDGGIDVVLSLGFSKAEVKNIVNGKVTAAGVGEDGGLTIIALLESSNTASAYSGDAPEAPAAGGDGADADDVQAEEIVGNLGSGAKEGLNFAAALAYSSIVNQAEAIVGDTAELKSEQDITVQTSITERLRLIADSNITGEDSGEDVSSFSISGGVVVSKVDNTARAVIKGGTDNGAELDAGGTVTVKSTITYPYLADPEGNYDLELGDVPLDRDALIDSLFVEGNLGDVIADYLSDNVYSHLKNAQGELIVDQAMLNSWSRSSSASGSFGAAGAVNYLRFRNYTEAVIEEGAKINQDPTYRTDDQTVALDSGIEINMINVAGLPDVAEDEGSTSSGARVGFGGALLIVKIENITIAEAGGEIQSGIDGELTVKAASMLRNLLFAQSGTEAESFGFNGTFSDNDHLSTTIARILPSAVVTGGPVKISAEDEAHHFNMVGGVLEGGNVGIGLSAGRNRTERQAIAGIGYQNQTAGGSYVIDTGQGLDISAGLSGKVFVLSLASTEMGDDPDAEVVPEDEKDTADESGEAPDFGDKGNQGSFGLGISGDAALNNVEDTVLSFISENIRVAKLGMSSLNETSLLAASGSQVLVGNPGAENLSIGVTGSYSQNTITNQTKAYIHEAVISLEDLAIAAVQNIDTWALSSGSAKAPSESGFAVAGSVAINKIDNTTWAELKAVETAGGEELGDIQTSAVDNTVALVIAGSETVAGTFGFGPAFAYNDVELATTARVLDSVINQSDDKTLEILANSSPTLYAAAASSAETSGLFAISGTLAMNKLITNTTASLEGTTRTGGGDVFITAVNGSSVLAVTGSGAEGGVGVGVALSFNNLNNQVTAVVQESAETTDKSEIYSAGDIQIKALADITVEGFAIGTAEGSSEAGSSNTAGGDSLEPNVDTSLTGTNQNDEKKKPKFELDIAASMAYSDITNDLLATVKDAAVLNAGGDVIIKAELTQRNRHLAEGRTGSELPEAPEENEEPDASPSGASADSQDSDGLGLTFSGALIIASYNNTALALIEDATVDAKEEVRVEAGIHYPFLADPDFDLSGFNVFDRKLREVTKIPNDLKEALHENFSVAAQLMNSWARSVGEAETFGLSGGINIATFNNHAEAAILDGAEVNMNHDFGTDTQSVFVNSMIELEQLSITGVFDFNIFAMDEDNENNEDGDGDENEDDENDKLDWPAYNPSGGADSNIGVGGAVLIYTINNQSIARIAEGAKVSCGEYGEINISALSRVTNYTFAQAGASSGSFGFAGTFAMNEQDSTVLAQVESGAEISGGNLRIKAYDNTEHINLAGAVLKGENLGFGFTVSINDIKREALAGIGSLTDEPGTGTTVDFSGDIEIDADLEGIIYAISLAAATFGDCDEGHEDIKNGQDTDAVKGDSPSIPCVDKDLDKGLTESPADTGSQGSFGLGISGDVSLNFVNDTARAFINDDSLIKATGLTLNSSNDSCLISGSGSAVLMTGDGTNVGIAGSYSQNTITGKTASEITGANLELASLTMSANREGNLWAVSAGGSGAAGDTSVGIAGSVSINRINNETETLLRDVSFSVTGDTSLESEDASSMVVVAGGLGYGGLGGVGAAVALNKIENETRTAISDSTINHQGGSLDLRAANRENEIASVAASLGFGGSDSFIGTGGTVSINRIANTVETLISTTDYDSKATGPISLDAADDSKISSLAGAVGASLNTAGVGIAVAYNKIDSQVQALIDSGTTLKTESDVNINAGSHGEIKTISASAGLASTFGGAGSVSVNTVTGGVEAAIIDSFVETDGDIIINALNSAEIGSIAGSVSGASTASVAASVAVNNIGGSGQPHRVAAYIENSRVESDQQIELEAKLESVIKSITGAGTGAGTAAVNGSVSVNRINSDAEAYIINCSGNNRFVEARNNISLDAVDAAAVTAISGSVSGAGTFAGGAAVSIVNIGSSSHNRNIRAYIESSEVTSTQGSILLTAESDSVIFNIAAGLAGSGTVSLTGSVAVNNIYNEIAAVIQEGSIVEAHNNVVLKTHSTNRDTIPQGALQYESDSTPAGNFGNGEGYPEPEDWDGHEWEYGEYDSLEGDEEGEIGVPDDFANLEERDHDTDITSILSIAGGVAGSGSVSGGAAVATNNINTLYNVSIINSTVTAITGDVILNAESETSIRTLSATIVGSGLVAGAGSVSTNWIQNEITATISGSAVTSGGNIELYAGDSSIIQSLSGQISGSGAASVGAAVTYNDIENTIKASIEDSSTIEADKNVLVIAESNAAIQTIAAGVSGAAYAGVAGTVSVNYVENTILAYIEDSTVTARHNIYLLAESDSEITFIGGAIGGAFVGAAGTVSVNSVSNEIKAYISQSTVTALGEGGSVLIRRGWTSGGNEQNEIATGLAVIASSKDEVNVIAGALAIGFVGVSGEVSVNRVANNTAAYISGSTINLPVSGGDIRGAEVKVKAYQFTDVDVKAAVLAAGGVAVGGVVDNTLIKNHTRAYITGSSTIYTATGLDLYSQSQERVEILLAGIGGGLLGSVSGNVAVIGIKSLTESYIENSDVYSLGPVSIEADSQARIVTDTFNVSAGFIAAGGSVAVNTISNTTFAGAVGAHINSPGAISIKAASNDHIETFIGSAAIGAYTGSGNVSVNTIDSDTDAVVKTGTRPSEINQHADFRPGGTYAPGTGQKVLLEARSDATIDPWAGAAGISLLDLGGIVDVSTIRNRTVAMVGTETMIYARGDVIILADSNKKIDSAVYSGTLGLAAITGAVSVSTTGGSMSVDNREHIDAEVVVLVGSDNTMEPVAPGWEPGEDPEPSTEAFDRANQVIGDVNDDRPDNDYLFATNPDAPGKETAAFIENAASKDLQAVIISEGDIIIKATNTTYLKSKTGMLTISAVGIGVSVSTAEAKDVTRAYAGDHAHLEAVNLNIRADGRETVISHGIAGSLGVLDINVNHAIANIASTTEAYLGSNTFVLAENDVLIEATTTPAAEAEFKGVNVGILANIGYSKASATVKPTVHSYIGSGSEVVIGFQPLSGYPMLTFTSEAEFSGTSISFVHIEAVLSGDPTLTLNPGTGDNPDTITRNTGSWLDDGFVPGYPITVITGEVINIYNVAAVSDDVLTLQVEYEGHRSFDFETPQNFTGAEVLSGKPFGEIRREDGSWLDDGFFPGQLIEVSGTNHNNGHFQIESISADGKTLFMDVSDDIVNETLSGDQVTITGDTADRIIRDTGSWDTDGFKRGHHIRVYGTEFNDGLYRIRGISDDGRQLILYSSDQLTKEITDEAIFAMDDYDDDLAWKKGAQTVWRGTLTVNAFQLVPAGAATADARAHGSGGGIVSVPYNTSHALSESEVRAGVLDNANLQVAGTININTVNNSKQRAKSDGYNFGVGAISFNHSLAESKNVTETYLQNNITVITHNLNLTAGGIDDNYAEAFAGCVGAVAATSVKANTKDTSRTTVYLGTRTQAGFEAGGLEIEVNELKIEADHLARFNSRASGVIAGLVGVGNTRAENEIEPLVEIIFGSGVTVWTKNLVADAANRAEKNWLPGGAYNTRSISGSLLDIPGASSVTNITTTTDIKVLNDALLMVMADHFTQGTLTMNILNSVVARDKAKLENSGLISKTDARSYIDSECLASIEIGSGAELIAMGDINLGTISWQELETYTRSYTYVGAAGLSTGHAYSNAETTNHVLIGSDALLSAGGDINLLAGKDSANRKNNYDIKSDIVIINYSAIPLETSPQATATITQNNNITVASGALLEAIKDANLLTSPGITRVHARGQGRNLYTDLLGLDVYEGNKENPIVSNATVLVDGTIAVGIKNKLWLIIDEDGNPLSEGDGPEDWMTLDQRIPYLTRVESRVTNLFEELEQLRELMVIYGGTDAEFAYQLQIDRVIADLEELGFGEEEYNDLTGEYEFIPDRYPFIHYIIIRNLVAQSSYINIETENYTGVGKQIFGGSGVLIAPGDSEIYIENRSTSYLRLAGVDIPPTGGDVVLNGWAIDERTTGTDDADYNHYINTYNSGEGPQANFTFNIGIPPGEDPSITVWNTNPGDGDYPAPDIEVTGNINNLRGSLNLISQGAVILYGEVNVATNYTEASRFVLNYVDTIHSVGGEPDYLWLPVTRITEAVITRTQEDSYFYYLGTHYENQNHAVWSSTNFDSPGGWGNTTIEEGIAEALAAPSESALRADSVYIYARYLNINGIIQAGREYNLTFDSNVVEQIDYYLSRTHPPLSYRDAPLQVDGTFTAYFDTINNTIIVENLRVTAGYAELFGQIMNTSAAGSGRIEVLDGYGSINIDNQTGYDILLKGMDSGEGGSGKLVIYDSSWMQKDCDGNPYFEVDDNGEIKVAGQPVMVVYEKIDGALTAHGGEIRDSDGNVTGYHEQGLIKTRDGEIIGYLDLDPGFYHPFAGQRYVWTTAQEVTYRRTTTYRDSTWIGLIHWSPSNIYSLNVRPAPGEPKTERIGDYVVLDPDNADYPYLYIFESYDTAEPEIVSEEDWVKKKWWGTRTYYKQVVEAYGQKFVHHHSITADNPISIVFTGSSGGSSIEVQSDANIILDGPIMNAGGGVSFTSTSAIERTDNNSAYISASNINLSASQGIGNDYVMLIELQEGGMFNATAGGGLINIREIRGDLVYGEIINTGGDVFLYAGFNVQPGSAGSLIKGDLIEIMAGRESIGSEGQPVIIESLSGLSAFAGQDIYIKQLTGDFKLVRVESRDGTVWLEAVDGRFLDANEMRAEDSTAIDEVLELWKEGFSGNYTAAELHSMLPEDLDRIVNTRFYSEDFNVRGMEVYLKASGSIGNKYDIQIALGGDDFDGLSTEEILLLFAAEPGDITYYDASNNILCITDGSTPVAYINIAHPEDINVEAVISLSAEAGGDIYLGSGGEMRLLQVKGEEVRLKSRQGIYDVSEDNYANIVSTNLLLEAAGGPIGAVRTITDENDEVIGTEILPVSVSMADNSLLNARAYGSIYLSGVAGSGRQGALNIDYIYAAGSVSLEADGFIRDANNDDEDNIRSRNLDMTARSIGEAGNYLEINLAESGIINATANAGSIHLFETGGSMNIGEIFATGNVNLTAQGSIFDAFESDAANISAVNITLSALTGPIGTADHYLDLASDGLVNADSPANIYLKEIKDNLTIGRITSDETVYLVSTSGGILNGITAGNNIESEKLRFDALTTVGTGTKPLNTAVSYLEGLSGTGGIWIVNEGPLTIGGVEEDRIISVGPIQLTVKDFSDPGDDLTVPVGVLIRSTGGSITLRAGDDLHLNQGSTLEAAGSVFLYIDYGNADPGVGGVANINGTINASEIEIWGDDDDDTFNLVTHSFTCPVEVYGLGGDDIFNLELEELSASISMYGGDGDDVFNIYQLPSLTSEVNGVRDTVTLDGEAGSDTYNIFINGEVDCHHIINVWDSGTDGGVDLLNIYGTENSDVFLLRREFIAVLHETDEGFSDEFERINYNSNIEKLYIDAIDGENRFYLDDNSAVTTIQGGPGNDFFQVGQMFGSDRIADDANTLEQDRTGILPGDDINTVHTTRGYLSYGISYETTIYGGAGDDTFSVYSNLAVLNLFGEAGNDTFIVRAFALYDQDDPERQEYTNVFGGDGNDYIAYHINAPVNIDGGSGFNTVVIIGTEFPDTFIITAEGVYGAGRSVEMVNIQSLEIDGMEGDDTFFIQGTKKGMVTRVIGGLGSDTFYIMGDVTRGVVAGDIEDSDIEIHLVVDHDLGAIQGPLYILGGVDEEADRTLYPGIALPYEESPELPELVLPPHEDEDVDAIFIYNDDSPRSDIGVLTADNLSGLGMGTDMVANRGTEDDPDYVTYNGGITYHEIEILEILLGSGDDTLTIEDTAVDAITAVHGGGGDDTITIESRTGPLVVYGDTSACGTRYSSTYDSEPSVHGNNFNNPGDNTIDASASELSVVIYGGVGSNTIRGSQVGDFLAGGPGDDEIHGTGGNNIIYGDSGFNVGLWEHLLTVVTTENGDCLPTGDDTIYGGPGDNIIFGDHGQVTLEGFDEGIWALDTPVEVVRATTVSTLGGNDTITAGDGDNLIFGGSGDDTITTGNGDNIIFGDNGLIEYETGDPALIESISPEFGGNDNITTGTGNDIIIGGNGNDWIEATGGDNIILGDNALVRFNEEGVPVYIESIDREYGGDNIILGGPGEDILVGGSFSDVIDGGAGDDLIFGDNVTLDRTETLGEMVNPRYRVLEGGLIYDATGNPLVTDEWQEYPGDAPVWADWVITLHYDYDNHGDDYIAGGPGNNMIFGQGGDDTIQGNGSVDSYLAWLEEGDEGENKPVYAYRDDEGRLQINPSFSADTDGDNYIEGGPGSDTIFGNLGQDDIIGGSSSLFGLDTPKKRGENGGNMIFGGSGETFAGELFGRNAGSDCHASDADYILGGNGNIYRLVGLNGTFGEEAGDQGYLTFNYDEAYYGGDLRLIPRAVELLDYTIGGPDRNEEAWGDSGHDKNNLYIPGNEIHGEDGNDFIHGGPGDSIIYGGAGDDIIIGGWGNNWISGGTGTDGIIGSDGWMAVSINSTTGEPLYGVEGFEASDLDKTISLQGGTFEKVINVSGELKMTAHLSPLWLTEEPDPDFRPQYTNSIIYGGLGGDYIHGAHGDNAISGAEALPEFYENPSLAIEMWAKILEATAAGEVYSEGMFSAFNPYAPFSLIRVDDNGLWSDNPADREFLLNFNTAEDAGNDVIFGGPGNNWLVGATGSNHLYGGWGNGLLDANSRIADDEHSSYAYGGAGRDVLIANSPDDRLIDWTGEFNNYYVPFNPYGLGTVSRHASPGLVDFILQLAESDGADITAGIEYGGDPDRNGEPYGELGLVVQQDEDAGDNRGQPRQPRPGNKSTDDTDSTATTSEGEAFVAEEEPDQKTAPGQDKKDDQSAEEAETLNQEYSTGDEPDFESNLYPENGNESNTCDSEGSFTGLSEEGLTLETEDQDNNQDCPDITATYEEEQAVVKEKGEKQRIISSKLPRVQPGVSRPGY